MGGSTGHRTLRGRSVLPWTSTHLDQAPSAPTRERNLDRLQRRRLFTRGENISHATAHTTIATPLAVEKRWNSVGVRSGEAEKKVERPKNSVQPLSSTLTCADAGWNLGDETLRKAAEFHHHQQSTHDSGQPNRRQHRRRASPALAGPPE